MLIFLINIMLIMRIIKIMNKLTQNQKLVRRMSNGKNITEREAYTRYKVANLSARISELREAGFPIYTNRVLIRGGQDRGKYVTGYRLNFAQTPKTLLNNDFWFTK